MRLVFVIFLLFAVPLAKADLEWKTTKLESNPPAEAETVKGEFVFINRSATPVTIVSALPACDCTTAVIPEQPVQPGGEGKIELTFTAEQRSGEQTIPIAVWTDLPEDKPIELTWKIQLPDVLTLKPEALIWLPETKTPMQQCEIQFPSAPETRLLSAEADDPAFEAKLEGNVVRVTRREEPSAEITLLRIRTNSPLPRLRELHLPLVSGGEGSTEE